MVFWPGNSERHWKSILVYKLNVKLTMWPQNNPPPIPFNAFTSTRLFGYETCSICAASLASLLSGPARLTNASRLGSLSLTEQFC